MCNTAPPLAHGDCCEYSKPSNHSAIADAQQCLHGRGQAGIGKWGYVSGIERSLQMGTAETRWKIKVLLSVNWLFQNGAYLWECGDK